MSLTAFLNNTNGIVQPIPAGIAPQLGPYSSQYIKTDIAYDYAIGGIPFIAGESGRGTYFRRIYERSFSPIRKDQFDNQQTPGEQSIWGWWLRSQSTFSEGAGVQFLDTTEDATLGFRYSYSEGLDTLSTPGQVALLPQTQGLFTGTGPMQLRSIYASVNPTAADGVLVLDIGAKQVTSTSYGSLNSTYTMPGGLTGVANTFTDDGTNYYFADKTGIYQGAIATPLVAATKIWNVPSTSGNYVLGWIKGRLVAGLDNNVYELVGTGPALPTPKYSHPNTKYVYTAISEIESAILVAGNAGGAISQITRFTLDNAGVMPTLTSGIVAATLPFGESILSMYAYIGAFIGIGTNKGFRVAVADGSGNVTYGPLVVQDPLQVGVHAIGGYDRFLFIGNQGNTMVPQQGWANPTDASTTDMLIRIDLSQTTSTGSQPYANDVMSPTTAIGSFVNSITNMGTNNTIGSTVVPIQGCLAWAVGGQVFATRNNGQKIPSGFMYTPKIRYNTLEPKHFKYVYLRHPDISDGSIDIYGQNPNSGLSTIALGLTGSSTNGSQTPFFIADIGNAQEWFQFKFIIHRGTSGTVSPILNGYQLRALPGVTRQVIIQVPLLCFDHEEDKFGVDNGDDGFAYQRIKAIESLTASGNIVLFQDLNYNDANLVIVDDYTFEQQAPELAKAASSNNQDSNAHGGYLILVCRVIQ